MLLFLNYRNMDPNLNAESKNLSYRFQERYKALEDYITEVNRRKKNICRVTHKLNSLMIRNHWSLFSACYQK